MKNEYPNKIVYFTATFLLIIVQLIIVFTYLESKREYEKQLHIDKQYATYHASIESINLSFGSIAQTSFDILINTPKVQKLMAEANIPDPKIQDKIRQQLYREFFNTYQILESHNLRQLHFHLPNSISFLRFHSPLKFGDSLVGIRPSIDAVNRTHRSVSGFEEGRIFNGFRHVFPIFYDQKFVGSVELSYSFAAIREQALKLYPARYDMVLKREIVTDTVFKQEQENYSICSLNEDFVKDERIHSRYDPLFTRELTHQIHLQIQDQAKEKMKSFDHFTLETEIEGMTYLIMFNPIDNFLGEKVGYFMIYIQDQHLNHFKNEFMKLSVLVAFVIVGITIALAALFYRLQLNQLLLKRLATHDRLTGLYNRGYISNKLQYLIRYSYRHKRPLSIIFFDIDHFKKINDIHGHGVGDSALIDLGMIVSERLRQSDLFGRWGGEEFVIILPETSLDDAINVAEKLRIVIEEHHFRHGMMTCSFGVAELGENESEEVLLEHADQMLYEAKAAGRNQVRPNLN